MASNNAAGRGQRPPLVSWELRTILDLGCRGSHSMHVSMEALRTDA